jgi:hypothetical protein
MSNPYLPAELLDHVIDHLHDTKDALRRCCLVSKLWIPRTRKHLFTDVKFHTEENLRSWKHTFPDPSTSPACYTNTLFIRYPRVVTIADAGEGGWITTFSRVAHLEIEILGTDCSPETSLVPFHGFSPVLKSLHVSLRAIHVRPSHVLDLICSFPLLEDLSVLTGDDYPIDSDEGFDRQSTSIQPSNLPAFTGTLELNLSGARSVIWRLMSLPGGLRFRKLNFRWNDEEDVLLTMALVERCCYTLELLKVGCQRSCAFIWYLPPPDC